MNQNICIHVNQACDSLINASKLVWIRCVIGLILTVHLKSLYKKSQR